MSRMGVEPSIVCQESRFKFQLSIIVRNGDLTMKVAQIVDFINPRYFLLKNKDLVMLVATDKAEQTPTATPRARLVGQSTGPSGKKGHLWTLPTGECFVMYRICIAWNRAFSVRVKMLDFQKLKTSQEIPRPACRNRGVMWTQNSRPGSVFACWQCRSCLPCGCILGTHR